MTSCIKLQILTFCLSFPDNDMEVPEDQQKEGELQNIWWLSFHPNTPIKAHTEAGWEAQLRLTAVICKVLCSAWNGMFIHLMTSWVPDSTLHSLKILHVRYTALQTLISTATFPNTILFIQLTGALLSDQLKWVTKKEASNIPLQHVPGDITNTTVSA